jgi:hypothetical protein
MSNPDSNPERGQEQAGNKRFALTVVAVSAASWLAYWAFSPKEVQPSGILPAEPLKPIQISAPGGNLRPDVEQALGKELVVPGMQQLDLVRGLGNDLNEEEREAILAAIAAKRQPNIPAGWHSEFVHELSLVLQREKEGKDRFARVLATVAVDPSRDEVVRDYAIQHLRQVWENSGEDPRLRKSIEATFRKLAKEDFVLSASALLSLHLLGTLPSIEDTNSVAAEQPGRQDHPAISDGEIAPLVVGLLAEPPSSENTKARMTALRIVGDRKLAADQAHVRQIASGESEYALVRMAAISALVKFGDPSSREFLESLDRKDPRIDSAVRHALARLH